MNNNMNNINTKTTTVSTVNYPVYYPHEDSYLIQKHIVEYAKNKEFVLDMGTGTGILAREAAKYAKKVLALDINQEALKIAEAAVEKEKSSSSSNNIIFKHSDLFSSLNNSKNHNNNQFDLIIFNPPYLPKDNQLPDIALDGGKNGYELIGRFLDVASGYLNNEGVILLLFSSLTKKNKVDEYIKKNLFEKREIDSEKFSFEELYVYEIKKTKLLQQLEENNIMKIKYFTRGNRGILYRGRYKQKNKLLDIVIKTKNDNSTALNRIQNEVFILSKFKEKKIEFTPDVLLSNEDFFVYEFIDGELIEEYLNKASQEEIVNILKKILEFVFKLDQLKINKEEMHRPVKHILITKDKEIKMIDFERAHYTDHPKNLTQFCQFLTGVRLGSIFKKKEIKLNKKNILTLAKKYRKNPDEKIYKKIAEEIMF